MEHFYFREKNPNILKSVKREENLEILIPKVKVGIIVPTHELCTMILDFLVFRLIFTTEIIFERASIFYYHPKQ